VFSPRQGNASLAADIISCGHWFGCAWLVSPWTDLTLFGSTLLTKDVVDPIIHKACLAELAEAYLGTRIWRPAGKRSPTPANSSAATFSMQP
jgi:hypothetical protein